MPQDEPENNPIGMIIQIVWEGGEGCLLRDPPGWGSLAPDQFRTKVFNATATGMQRFTILQLIDRVCNTLAPLRVCIRTKLQDIYNYKRNMKIVNNIAVEIKLSHDGSDMCVSCVQADCM